MDNNHCPQHGDLLVTLAEINNDVKWIRKLANIALIVFVSGGGLSLVVAGVKIAIAAGK